MDCDRGQWLAGVYRETDMLFMFEKEFVYEVLEALHIPGGISTGFSIIFLVIATEVVRSQNPESKDGVITGPVLWLYLLVSATSGT